MNFIKCTQDFLTYEDSRKWYNHVVNLDCCHSFDRMRQAVGQKMAPAIFFSGTGVVWAYESELIRDKDYERIMRIVGLNFTSLNE